MNLLHHHKNRSVATSSGGFTLLELMVAISILVMLCGLVMQLMGSATRLTSSSKQASDCDSEARFALAQISHDLGHRIQRSDVDAFLEKNKGNDRFFLFSETPGWMPSYKEQSSITLARTDEAERSTVSLVGYRVYNPPGSSSYQLQRLAKAIPWTSRSGQSLPFVALNSMQTPMPNTTLAGIDSRGTGGTFPDVLLSKTSQDAFYQVLADNVIRFEVTFLRKSNPSNSSSGLSTVLRDNEIAQELASYGFTRLSAVVISLAVVDSQNMAKLSAGDLAPASYFNDTVPTDYPLLPMDQWNRIFSQQSSGWARPLKSGIRFYQRTISL
jgi:prepilin-type N-terminal cleavage/methylation domain-containing protein